MNDLVAKCKSNSLYGQAVQDTKSAIAFKGACNMKDVILYMGVNLSITEDEVRKLNKAHTRAEVTRMQVMDDFTINVGEYTYRRVDNNDGTLTVYKTDNRTNDKVWAIITE